MFRRTKQLTPAQMVLRVIWDIQSRKRAACRHPDHALLIGDKVYLHVSQVLTREGFARVLDKLVDDGIIQRGNTITDPYIRLVEFEGIESPHMSEQSRRSPRLNFNEQ